MAGASIKGPADKLMRGLGLEVSAYSVANLYKDFLDVFILDAVDFVEKARIEKLGLKVRVTNTVMKSLKDKIQLIDRSIKGGSRRDSKNEVMILILLDAYPS